MRRRSRARTQVLTIAIAGAQLLASNARARADDAPVVHLEVPRAPGLPQIERRAGDGIWQRVCDDDCDVRLPVAYDYRIGGRGVVDSAPFRLPRDASHVTVRAHVGSSMLQAIGIGFLVSGLVFITGGAALFAVPNKPSPDSPRVVGVGFAAMGALSVGLGLALSFGNGSTEVELRPTATGSR